MSRADISVQAESRREQPYAAVAQSFALHPARALFLKESTPGEIRKGVVTLPDAQRRWVSLRWLETDLPRHISENILAVDTAVADRWGRIVAQAGRPLPAIDSLLGATAAQHDLIHVTHNQTDVQRLGVQTLNPFE